jgi:hypothetical protein
MFAINKKEVQMALKKTLMIAGAVTSIGLGGASLAAHAASAESGNAVGPPGMDGLVSKIAEEFNLNEDEVEAVFEEHKEEMHAKHEARMEERLTQAVAEGKLTEEQKAKILAKFEEMKQDRPPLQEIEETSPDERKQVRLEKHDELEKWAEENGIPEEYLRFGPVIRFEHKP